MIKRLIWLGTGFGLGVAASVRARRSTAQLAPSAVVEQLRRDLEAAVEEGRREMRAREDVLRALLARPGRGSADAGR